MPISIRSVWSLFTKLAPRNFLMNTKELLQIYNLNAKKKLSQNFILKKKITGIGDVRLGVVRLNG